MAHNLVVCCDGTGNVWKPSSSKTNVVKLVEALVRDDDRQLFYYDPGVGTPDGYLNDGEGGLSWKDTVRRVSGLAWGQGVWTNVAQAYLFLVSQYQPGDRIFLFGFSRGAFTVRAVGGLINLCGLMKPGHENLVPTLLTVYRSPDTPKRKETGKELMDRFSYRDVPVWFTGVWDTVESVGIIPILVGAHITSARTVKNAYQHVRHAVALDESRYPFEPRLYIPPGPNEAAEGTKKAEERTFKQVYFCGAHCDVGGGYTQSGLSNAALHWLVREANAFGLLVNHDRLQDQIVNPLGKIHDEVCRIPFWVLAGAFARDIEPGELTIHETVEARINAPAARYRPRLPSEPKIERTRTEVVRPDGDVEQRDVPTKALISDPYVERIKPWMYVWLVLAAAATYAVLAAWGDELTALAHIQLWRDGHDMFRLGHALEVLRTPDDPQRIGTLLLKDALLIVSYVALLPILVLLLLRFSSSNSTVDKRIGAGAWAGALLPAADVIENWATMRAWVAHSEQWCSPLPCNWLEIVYSVLCSLASVIKEGALAVLLLLGAYCIIAGLVRILRSRPSRT